LVKDQAGISPWDEVHKNKGKSGYDHIYASFVKAHPTLVKKSGVARLVLWMGLFEIAMIVLFGTVTEYDPELAGGVHNTTINGAITDETRNAVQTSYPFYQDVHVMIFIGFGYLMVFLRKNAYSSLAFTFLISAFCIQWFILVGGFWECLIRDHWEPIKINIKYLIRGDFAAGAVMITYGVVLGKVSSLQLFVIALLEMILYSLNETISLHMKITEYVSVLSSLTYSMTNRDVCYTCNSLGGSMVIHMFGAFFGLALSMVITPKAAFSQPDNSAVYHSDVMAMVRSLHSLLTHLIRWAVMIMTRCGGDG
jgi:ammonium transporter Rh